LERKAKICSVIRILQSRVTRKVRPLGGNGDAVFKDSAGDLGNNVGRIFTTVSTGRQIQLDAGFIF